MTDRYLRSTDGNDADNGSTWALAKATLAGLAAIDAAGDTLFVSQAHSEDTAGAVTIDLAGTLASPTRLLCANDGAEPPTALATGGQIATTGSYNITVYGCAYIYGLTFRAAAVGSGSNANIFMTYAAGSIMKMERCFFYLAANHSTPRIFFNHITTAYANILTKLKDCTFRFSNVGQRIHLTHAVEIRGGGLHASSSAVTAVFNLNGARSNELLVDGFDMSAMSSSGNIFDLTDQNPAKLVVRNSKLPASWSGSLVSTAPFAGLRVEMFNCDSADTNYRLWIEDYCGSIKHETTLVKTGGASDGDTPLSWKMAASTNAKYPLHVLRSPEIFSERITAVGGPKTITVDVLRDSATNLKDDEIWLEVQYLGTPGYPLSLFSDDCKADVLAAGADQAASSATWTTTGMANPNKQKLEVTFTPEEKGVAIVTVCMAKASTTVYVDPVAQVS